MTTIPARTTQFGQDVYSFIREAVAPKIVDTVLRDNVFFQLLFAKGGEFDGKDASVTFKVRKNTNGGSFSGFDTLNASAVQNTEVARFEPRFYEKAITLAGTELTVSTTKNTVIKLAIASAESATQDFMDDLGNALYGDGTGNSGKDLTGISAAIDTAVTSYGGLVKGNYLDASGGVRNGLSLIGGNTLNLNNTIKLTLDHIKNMITLCTSGSFYPHIALIDPLGFDYVEKLMPSVQVNTVMGQTPASMVTMDQARWGTYAIQAMVAQAGYTSIRVKNTIFVVDEKCPVGKIFFINIDTWKMDTITPYGTTNIGVASDLIVGQYEKNLKNRVGFGITDYIPLTNQYAELARVIFAGNLYCTNPARNGLIKGIDYSL